MRDLDNPDHLPSAGRRQALMPAPERLAIRMKASP
jgi:hypothetical protein